MSTDSVFRNMDTMAVMRDHCVLQGVSLRRPWRRVKRIMTRSVCEWPGCGEAFSHWDRPYNGRRRFCDRHKNRRGAQ